MAVQWRKSTHSSGVNDEHCVELGRLVSEAGIGVRDSKDPDRGHLALSGAQFADLIEQVKQHGER
ncbi:DUF397 domain-containing protein [Actinomadura geliboluensis]|uniref:DUF397 domain-containing protein n=1 Tax=Actinomadura geliboluensis TaxID=882440 RepID=A0A5S4H6J2_9ACTN|nr:DUF397 domain-containing protein [Actinomadura geliboluensis]TMR40737.1 DUF397 domain-containing protein [Actinomadura geliboluensis]